MEKQSNGDGKPESQGKQLPGWVRPLIFVLVVLALFISARIFGFGEKIGLFRDWIESLGTLGMLVFVFVYIAATVATVPGSAITVAAGALFGSVYGVILVSAGSTAGAALSFLISRHFARESIVRWLGEIKIFKRLDRLTEHHGAVIVALTRLIPIFPFNILNYGFGITLVKFSDYVLWSWLCMLPMTIVFVVGADAVTKSLAHGQVPWPLIGIALGMLSFLVIIIRFARKKLIMKETSTETSKKNHDRLIIFTRYPEPGTTKTRLIPALGEEGAAELQRNMTIQTVLTARQFNKHHPVSIEVHYEGGSADAMRAWIGEGVRYIPQSRGDLGERMANAFRAAFRDGALNAVLVGTDCPDVSADDLQNAFSVLNNNDLVLGPASDGGYYLAGMRKECLHRAVPALFKGMNWGSGDVLSDTFAAAENSGLSCGVGRTLDDIDRPEDMEILKRTREKISVIIPAINEAENIEAVLTSAVKGTNIEIIVADGGSVDDTPGIAHKYNATILSSSPCRAIQMNDGVRYASGDILLFLHADTLLPSGYDDMVRMACKDSSMVCGAFELRIKSPVKFLRIIEKTIQFRSKRLHMPYGDQALFMKADIFREAGGFPEMPIMEDYELVKRLKRKGMVTIVPAKATTSARRWETVGFWRTTLINQLIIAAYTLGVSPSRLYRWYYRDK